MYKITLRRRAEACIPHHRRVNFDSLLVMLVLAHCPDHEIVSVVSSTYSCVKVPNLKIV
jgi:hypothetical protein